MRVLAKFVGFVVSWPFSFENNSKSSNVVLERQIALRNAILPTFDIKPILLKAITDNRLTIVIPWLVQYLSMLDYVTLHLNYYNEVFGILFELYILSTSESVMLELTTFVLRTNLGWLFEHPNVPKEYYNYRQHRQRLPMILASEKCSSTTLERNSSIFEAIVVASCPFLSDLRVAIRPMNREKQLSRTGQYRHIRTQYAREPITPKKEEPIDNQSRLLSAFLQSQSTTTRKIIDFVIERVTSAVVKDFQFEQLLPKKKEAAEAIKNLKAFDEV